MARNLRGTVAQVARPVLPALLLFDTVAPGRPWWRRLLSGSALVGLWTAVYRKYRRKGLTQTAHEYELLKGANWDAFWRHYNERVPTIEQEFEIWGAYHQHRHEMRYDILGDQSRRYLPSGGALLDIGCGSALVVDRIADIDAHYVGLDFPDHHMRYVKDRFTDRPTTMRLDFVRGDGERLPFADGYFDVIVMSEVIEHLFRPEHAVWELARVMKPGGVFIMTTNNASEVPLRSPMSHLFAWLEKAFGAYRPELISMRPWIWPWPVDDDLTPEGSPPVYIPHTHHIYAQTRDMFAAAGLDTFHFSTFEFPPPQAVLSQRLDKMGEFGQQAVDVLERVAQATPLVNRLGGHLLMISRKNRPPVAPAPPPGIWPGPFSD